MSSLNDSGTAPDLELEGGLGRTPISLEAVVAQDLSASRTPGTVPVIVAALQKAVQTRHIYQSAASGARFADQLESELAAYLNVHQFLRLQVTPQGFRHHGAPIPNSHKPDLAAALAADGFLELLFKNGISRDELERGLNAFQIAFTTRPSGSTSIALWEEGLERLRFRCADELPGSGVEGLAGVNDFLPHDTGSQLKSDDLLRTPGTVGVAPQAPTAALVTPSPTSPEAASERAGRLLIELHAAPDGASELVAHLLGSMLDTWIEQGRIRIARGVLLHLRARSGMESAGEAFAGLLERVLERLCGESNVMALGRVLDGEAAEDGEMEAARDMLAQLDGAVGPLCDLLTRLESMQARKRVCSVLASVAAPNPGLLAERAAGQPWYVARNMAYVLGRIGTAEVVPHLRRWARHEESRVRVEVARALGRVHHANAANVLCDMLVDAESRVRQCAIWSIAAQPGPQVLPRLRRLLFEDREFRSWVAEERDDCFRTYGRLADARTFDELRAWLESRGLVNRGWSAELRRGAALALGEISRPEAAVPLLEEAGRTRDARLREACASALQSIHNRSTGASATSGGQLAKRIGGVMPRDGEIRLEFTDDV